MKTISRHTFNPFSFCLILLALALLAPACRPSADFNSTQETQATQTPASSDAELEITELAIAILPAQTGEDAKASFSSLEAYLTEQLGIPVTLTLAESYDATIEMMADERVYVAHLGPFSYIKAKTQNDALESIVTSIQADTGRPWYTSVIIASNASGIQELADIKGKRFSFVSESSTSGFLVPTGAFKDLEIDPDVDFATIGFAGSHDQNAAALAQGQTDAAAMTAQTYQEAKQSGQLPEDTFTLIWESDPIPGGPIVINTKLSEDLQSKLKEALVNAPPEVVNVIERSNDEGAGYTLVTDEDYDLIRRLHDSLGIEGY
ncbi:MAG: phosphate/phosphite/phosphonate ABC transporter substrate-binding protein [Spirulina sp. SIO3F2]|nr:phosphate/phosphite/phosphonate ABC transporter substrate-binding protein [Spirulina sp. SIO3F2]